MDANYRVRFSGDFQRNLFDWITHRKVEETKKEGPQMMRAFLFYFAILGPPGLGGGQYGQ